MAEFSQKKMVDLSTAIFVYQGGYPMGFCNGIHDQIYHDLPIHGYMMGWNVYLNKILLVI